MIRLLLVVVPLAVLAGCKTENPQFCANPANAGMQGCPDAGPPGGICQQDIDCTTPGFPACNTDKGMCAQCFASAGKNSCPSTAPHCDVDSCTACVDDTDCSNSVCMLDGSCAAPANVIHVVSSSGSTMNTCGSMSMPCTLTEALTLVTSTKNVIRLDDSGPYTPEGAGYVVNVSVTIDAGSAVLHRRMDAPILNVTGAVTVTLLGGRLQGTGSGAPHGDGLHCDTGSKLVMDRTIIEANSGSGLSTMDCTVAITRAKITGNGARGIDFHETSDPVDIIKLAQSLVTQNARGGLNIDGGGFNIIGNAFFDNGDATATKMSMNPNPAVTISTTESSTNHFDFNTILHNNSSVSLLGGLDCRAGAGLVADNNIIWNNTGPQISGNCMYSHSDIAQALSGNDAGGNLFADPKFMADPLTTFDASDPHLLPDSPVQGKADPGSNLSDLAAKDIDGEPRIKRGMGADIGADQYYPPKP